MNFKNIVLFFFICISSFAQEYADKNYYLVDSLELNKLSDEDKKIIHSSLKKFHSTDQDTLKVKYINDIVELSWDEKVWTRYNLWMNKYLTRKLKDVNLDKDELSKENRLYFSYLAATINNKAILTHEEGNYVQALNYYHECIEIQEQIKDSILLPEAYNNLGSLYHDIRNYDKAEHFYNKSLHLCEKYNNYRCVAMALTNVGQILSDRKELDSALVLLNKSLKVRELSKESYGIGITYDLIGEVYLRKEDYDKALVYFNKSLLLEQQHNDYKGAAISLIYLGDVYIKQGKFKEAREVGIEALDLAKKENALESQMKSVRLLRNAYQGENKWEQAFEMQQAYYKIKDSIQNDKIEKSIIIKQSAFDLKEKEKEIELLSAKNELQQLRLRNNNVIIWVAGIGIFLISLVALVVFGLLKRNKQINKLLVKQNEEKQVMMKEIHHRVKNNLQVINSLLRLQSYGIEDKKVIEMFKNTQRRVLSMAKLHETIYSTENMKLINVNKHLSSLIDDIVTSYGLDKDIAIKTNIVNDEFSVATLLPLSLIVNEIITNSLKYAFVNQKSGCVELQITKVGNNSYEMLIGDNGVGLKQLDEVPGLGTKLIKIFTKQLNGNIELLEKQGTVFKLSFKTNY